MPPGKLFIVITVEWMLLLLPGIEATDTMAKHSFLYFAYGSNLLKERLQLENPSAKVHCVALLQDYKLVFGNHQGRPSDRWHGGVATIEHSPGDEVWGVVWEMNVADIESLDRQENVRHGTYSAMEVSVLTVGPELTCRTYIMNSCVYAPPSPQYLKVIVMGAEQNGLPKDYQEKLRAIETNEYEGVLPVMEALERRMARFNATADSVSGPPGVDIIPRQPNHTLCVDGHFMYFAYGSNLLKERLQLKNPSAVFNGTGKLKDYVLKMGFWGEEFHHLNGWHGGVATIDESEGNEVWGVIWWIGCDNLRSLDEQEGVGHGFYRPLVVKVDTALGELLCRTYKMNNFSDELTSPQYKQVVYLGAEQNGLPVDYIKKLQALETNNYDGPSILDQIKAAAEQAG